MIIVNLTTTFQRLSLCRIALTSLLLQSRLPDRINLWVSQEPYLRDQGIADKKYVARLIQSLPEQASSRVYVRWVTNTGPYRKLIPILREVGFDDVIVTADDDIFFGREWLSELLQAYDESGGKPVAARVLAKKINLVGRRTSYLHWELINEPSVCSDNFVVTFGGGVVLNRSMFNKKDIEDDSFLEVAPTADDLWYSKLLEINANSIVVVPSALGELNFIKHHDGLTNNNLLSASSLLGKIRIRIWDRFLGFWGVAVCGNDMAYVRIERYFSGRKNLSL